MKKRTLKVCFCAAVAIAILILLIPTHNTNQMSVYASKWNDTSEIRSEIINRGYQVKCIVTTPFLLQNMMPEKTLFIAAGVEKQYTREEADAIELFLRSGGKAIVADDTGNANTLSSRFNVTFYGKRVYSENFTSAAEFVNAEALLWNTKYNLVLNLPTGLNILNYSNVDVLSYCKNAYLDWDGNARIDTEDKFLESLPVIVKVRVGYGTIVFISDASIFINSMQKCGDNKVFQTALIESLAPDTKEYTVIFDESRHASYESLSAIILLTSYNPAILATLITLGIVLAVIIAKSKGKEEWKHEFSLGAFKEFKPARIPERTAKAVIEKIKISYNISQIERLSDKQLDSIDPVVTKIVRGKRYSDEELSAFMKKLRARQR